MEKFDWANQTAIHPLGLAAVAVLGIATLLLPRRYAVIPMIIMACFVSSRQRVVILSLDWTLLRILVLLAWTRVLMRSETSRLRLHSLDYALLGFVLVSSVAGTIRGGTLAALVNRLGAGFDAAGMYLLFRALIRDWRDMRVIVGTIIVLSVPVAACFFAEYSTGRNFFSIFGGVPELTAVREGRLRCQGAFAHPIMAGCFFVPLVPLVAARWWTGQKATSALGVGLLICVIVMTASSTPLGGLGAVLLGALLFPLRRHMRLLRWGLAAVLVGLHMVMKAPVWHLIARIDLVGGSTGWHRYQVMDRGINRVAEWWLYGTDSTVYWLTTQDITNQYLLVGVRGGLLSLILFVTIISLAYRAVGRMCLRYRADKRHVILSWALGVSLLSHTIMFFAASYFGQVIVGWYLVLALIGSLSAPLMVTRRRPVPARSGRRNDHSSLPQAATT